ncbi:MAG: C25 family peptidase propeptide domain-containing protein, partial [Thermoplasmatota archaeon]
MKQKIFRKMLVLSVIFLLTLLVLTPNILGVKKTNNNENIKITLSTDGEKTIINYKIKNFIQTPVEIDGTNYMRVSFDGESNILIAGEPDIPNICRSIIIPDTAEMKVSVIGSTYEEYNNILIAPSKGNLLRTVNPDNVPFGFGDVYNIDNFYPGKIAELDEPYILRDYRGQVVKIYPIQYNPVKKTMRFYKEITVEVFPVGPDTRNIINRDGLPKKVEINFNQIYKHHFINYGTLGRYTPVEEQGNMLIITYDAFWNEMLPFYEWKILKGIPTEM